jgi:hypothetical protein
MELKLIIEEFLKETEEIQRTEYEHKKMDDADFQQYCEELRNSSTLEEFLVVVGMWSTERQYRPAELVLKMIVNTWEQ